MPKFRYKAKTKTAETTQGEIIADNKEEAVEKITLLGLMPVLVEEIGAPSRGGERLIGGAVRQKDIYLFSRQLVSLLKAGVPILHAMEVLIRQTKKASMRRVIDQLRIGIQQGKALSDGMSEYPRIFSSLYVAVVRAGEESGTLNETLASMAQYLEREEEIRSKVRGALVYPMIMALFGVGTVVCILTRVMPQITDLFVHFNQKLPWPTLVVMKASDFLIQYWMYITAGLVVLLVAVRQALSSSSGAMTISGIRLSIPVLRNFWIRLDVGRFCRTLSLLLKSGLSIVRAVQMSVPVVENLLIRKELAKCHDALIAGRSFADTLKETKIIPPLTGELVAVGEETGSLDQTLREMAEDYERQTNEVIRAMTTLLEPVMIIVVGAAVGFIVIAMLMPIFELDIMAG